MPIIPWLGPLGGGGGGSPQTIIGGEGGEYVYEGGDGGILGAVNNGVTGYQGGEFEYVGGTTGALIQASPLRIARIFFNGVDRSSWVKIGIRRSMTISGGSSATCDFEVTNADDLGTFRPQAGDEVVIYEGTARFFAGIVDSVDETSEYGWGTTLTWAVHCVDYGLLTDRRIIGWHYEIWAGALATNIMDAIAKAKLADLGVYFAGATVNDNIGIQTYNWVTVRDAFNSIARAVNGTWRIDFYKRLWLLAGTGSGGGYEAAPFDIRDNDGNWRRMTIQRGRGARRVNRQYVRNSQDLKTTWTQPFVVTNPANTIFVTMAQLQAKPIVALNGVQASPEKVIAVDEQTSGVDWDWLWQTFTVFRNPSKPLSIGDTVAVTYPSPMSHVEWAEDLDAIAADGLTEALEEVHDVPTIEAMQQIAAALLAQKQSYPVTATYLTQRSGLEAGMGQTIDTTYPLCAAEEMVIQQISSEEEGKGQFFNHTVTASTARIATAQSVWEKMISLNQQPKDRISGSIGFVVAGTVRGFTNPGVEVGVAEGVRTATKRGVARRATLFFKSTDTPTTSRIVIDIFKNGTSIFGAEKLIYPAGRTTPVMTFNFASDPLQVEIDDVFTYEVLEADSKAHDGTMIVEVVG